MHRLRGGSRVRRCGRRPGIRALRWALTHGPRPVATLDEVRALVAQGTTDALERLLAIGEPARRALLRVASEDDAVAARVRPWLVHLQAEEDLVEATSLASSIPGLLARGAAATARAHQIAPVDAPDGWGLSWWAERAHAYHFAPAADRFVAWEAWAPDAAPLRLRGRDRVVLEGSAGVVRWDSPTTVEFWVRWPHRTSAQYLLTDEAWPEMAPDVLPTATKRGFALRRNPTGDGRASLDLTLATAPNHWFSIESPPLAIRDDWEHVAVSSDGGIVRIFRDGSLVAARSLSGVRLLPGMGDLTIGAREHGLANRAAEFDLRALRISEGARYTDDFVPAQALPSDDATILSPDFTPADGSMGDRTLRGRRHAISGARWVPALDPASIRDAVLRFGGAGGNPSCSRSSGRTQRRVVPRAAGRAVGGVERRDLERARARRDGALDLRRGSRTRTGSLPCVRSRGGPGTPGRGWHGLPVLLAT